MTQLTISSLVSELTKLHTEHGDLPLVIVDADTSWPFKLKAKHIDVDTSRYLRKVVTFEICYRDEDEEEEEKDYDQAN